jgi:MurNAc alpha-1-phosphate uridylyltransferase
MILAAGRGERMRPLTDTTPKPLLFLGKYRLIEWQIMALVRAGIDKIVINYAWLGEQFPLILGDGTRYGCQLMYSPETTALETAGGIAKALPLLIGENTTSLQPFIVVSGDIYTDYDYRQLSSHLDGYAAHLVLVNNPSYHLVGDMCLVEGQIVADCDCMYQNNANQNNANQNNINQNNINQNKLTYGNIGVFNPAIFLNLNHQTLKLFPWLYAQGLIKGEHYLGNWHNIGTPLQLNNLNHSHNLFVG